jgi:isocitrate dehydrogenase (NAD+)
MNTAPKRPITVLRGDGIGPEVIDATLRVLEHLDLGFTFEIFEFGEICKGELPDNVIESFDRTKLALKGPARAGAYRSVTGLIRRYPKFDLYANVRPIFSMPKMETLFSLKKPLDLVIVRENSEGEYDVREQTMADGAVEVTSRYTPKGCERIARFAFEYTRHTGRKHVTIGHKRNIFRLAHGMFVDIASEVAKEYPDIGFSDLIIDNFALQVARDPWQFDVMLHTNLFGDIFSDLAAGLVHGSLGASGGANIGVDHAMFEATHGTADGIAGQHRASPIAMLHSVCLMFEYLNDETTATKLRWAIRRTLTDGIVTSDINPTRFATTEEWTDALIDRLS